LLAHPDRFGDCLELGFSLAGAGHSVEQEGRKGAGLHGIHQFARHVGLQWREIGRGMIGIGGGIILSPIILMLGWAGVKETAALSALFIFLNSVAGFLGASVFHIEFSQQLWILLPLTVAGGALGAYLGARKFSPKALKYVLAFVLAFAAVKLIIG
jgi:hypothetical protein